MGLPVGRDAADRGPSRTRTGGDRTRIGRVYQQPRQPGAAGHPQRHGAGTKARLFSPVARPGFRYAGNLSLCSRSLLADGEPGRARELVRLLSDDLVRYYDRRFAQYHGETLRVTGSRPDAAGFVVTSQIIRPDGPPIEGDWQLSVEGGLYKIGDVIIGVSIAPSERERDRAADRARRDRRFARGDARTVAGAAVGPAAR
jgi:hypothetical protein